MNSAQGYSIPSSFFAVVGHEREGLVFKEVGIGHPFSFKAVSNRYLLKLK